MSGVHSSIARTIATPDTASVKRLSWAYGCAKKGSTEESQLYDALLARFEQIIAGRKPS